jgi:hypothetical protein
MDRRYTSEEELCAGGIRARNSGLFSPRVSAVCSAASVGSAGTYSLPDRVSVTSVRCSPQAWAPCFPTLAATPPFLAPSRKSTAVQRPGG